MEREKSIEIENLQARWDWGRAGGVTGLLDPQVHAGVRVQAAALQLQVQ